MLRFVADSQAGRVLGMGLSLGNLGLLECDAPIVIDLAEHGGEGNLVLARGGEADLPALAARFPGGHLVLISDDALDLLRAGGTYQVPLRELGVPGFAVGLVFAGATELDLLEQLREAGVVAPELPIAGEEVFHRHEHGEVEDCPYCQLEREAHAVFARHDAWDAEARARPPAPLPPLPPGPAPSWRERVYAHPNWVALGVFVLAGLLALVIETC